MTFKNQFIHNNKKVRLLRAVKSTIGFISEAFPQLHSVGAIS
jgi:hypothetical protein